MKLYLRILSFVKPYTGQLTLALVASLFYVIFNSASIWLTASLINTIFEEKPVATQVEAQPQPTTLTLNQQLKNKTKQLIYRKDPIDTLKILCIVILSTFLFKNVFFYIQGLSMGFVNLKIIQDLRDRLYEKLNVLSMSFYDQNRAGNLSSILINDVTSVKSSISKSFTKLIVEPINILVMVSLLFVISWRLSLVAIIVIPVSAFFIVKIGQSIRRKSRRINVQIAEVMTILHEMLNNVRIVKAFATEDYENERFQKSNLRHFFLEFRRTKLSALTSPINEVLGVGIGVVLLWYGGLQVLHHQSLTSEDFIRFIIILFAMLQPLKSMSGVNNVIQNGLAAAERIFGILDSPVEIEDKPNAKKITEFKDTIAYNDVSFRYEDEWVLQDIDFQIKKGQVVAFVGPSGAGKSTVVDLLPRFYEVDNGSISVDGTDIRDLTQKSLRRLLGIVTQETILFNDTIAYNIAYGMDNVSQDAIEDAARAANAYEFIKKMPKGFETQIGDRGIKLSGGQRQRLSIARALLKNPPVLILDEATSSLDTESEQLVQSAIDQLMHERTTLVIAHRLSTVIHADLILVIENGRIVERGDHQTLLEQEGVYKRLYDIQFANNVIEDNV